MESVPGKMLVTRQYPGGEEESESTKLAVAPFAHNGIGSVAVSESMTINIGNYESIKFGVTVTLPTYKEEVQEAYDAAYKMVDDKVLEEVKKVKEYVRERKESGT